MLYHLDTVVLQHVYSGAQTSKILKEPDISLKVGDVRNNLAKDIILNVLFVMSDYSTKKLRTLQISYIRCI